MRLVTDRLLIRKFSESDCIDLAQILADPQVMEFSESGALTKEEVKFKLQDRILMHYEAHGYGLWALIHRETQQLIGYAGLINQEIDGDQYVELGYRLATAYWGKGLATEASLAIRDYAFETLGFDSLISIIDPKNMRSASVALKVGLTPKREAIFHGQHIQIYELNRLVLKPYMSQWQQDFAEEKERLEKVFAQQPFLFFHIGSTAISGCYAKPTIDILGVTTDITELDSLNAQMKKLGYQCLGEYGMKQRRFYRRREYLPVNLHVFEDSDPEASRHLAFVNFLRNHPEKVTEYSNLKRKLAEKFPGDVNQYCVGKEKFVKGVDCRAVREESVDRWFTSLGFRKSKWTDEEVLSAMVVNMHLHMTYFAKYVENVDLVFEPDVTVVTSVIPDDMFNYVIGAKFDEYNVSIRIQNIVQHYRKKNVPFFWWLGEKDTPVQLGDVLIKQGFSLKEDYIGMSLRVGEFHSKYDTDLSIQRVYDQNGLKDFSGVLKGIGGYARAYEDFYSYIPLALINEGAPLEMYVGYVEDQPVVIGILVLHGNVAGVYHIMTLPSHRKKGFGSCMIQYLLTRAQRKRYHIATLQARVSSYSLYQRLGFQSVCRFVEYAL